MRSRTCSSGTWKRGTTQLLSKPPIGAANGQSYDPSISSNGLKVAFTSEADNLMDIDIDAVPERLRRGHAASGS